MNGKRAQYIMEGRYRSKYQLAFVPFIGMPSTPSKAAMDWSGWSLQAFWQQNHEEDY